MKKKLFLITALSMILFLLPTNYVSAAPNSSDEIVSDTVYVEYLDDGSYLVTEIEQYSISSLSPVASTNATMSTTGGAKTVTHYSSAGVALCALKITGTFQYDGSTVSCVGTKSTKYSYNSNWSVEDVSTSHGNSSSTKAYARVSGKFVKKVLGITTNRISITGTVYCDKNGNIS